MKNFIILLSVLFLLLWNKINAQQSELDSAHTAISATADDTGKVNALNGLGKEYRFNAEYGKAINVEQEALKLSHQLNYAAGEAMAHNNTGNVLMDKGEYPSSLKEHFTALTIREKIMAKENSRSSIQAVADSYNNIGIVYDLEADTVNAMKYNLLSLSFAKRSDYIKGIARALHNIGLMYEVRGDYSKALQLETEALNIRTKAGDKKGIANSCNNISNVYAEQGMLKEAEEYMTRSLVIQQELEDPEGISTCLLNIGDLMVDGKKYTEARQQFEEALKIATGIESYDLLMGINMSMSMLDSITGNAKGALDHYKAFIAWRDSLQNEDNTRRTVQVQMQYDFDKKTSADSIRNAEQLKQENLKHDNEIRQQRLYTYGGIAGFVLMMIVAVVSFRAFRNKQRANEIIAHQKLIVELKQKEILDSIHYAKRIQRSLLPSEKYIRKKLNGE